MTTEIELHSEQTSSQDLGSFLGRYLYNETEMRTFYRHWTDIYGIQFFIRENMIGFKIPQNSRVENHLGGHTKLRLNGGDYRMVIREKQGNNVNLIRKCHTITEGKYSYPVMNPVVRNWNRGKTKSHYDIAEMKCFPLYKGISVYFIREDIYREASESLKIGQEMHKKVIETVEK